MNRNRKILISIDIKFSHNSKYMNTVKEEEVEITQCYLERFQEQEHEQ